MVYSCLHHHSYIFSFSISLHKQTILFWYLFSLHYLTYCFAAGTMPRVIRIQYFLIGFFSSLFLLTSLLAESLVLLAVLSVRLLMQFFLLFRQNVSLIHFLHFAFRLSRCIETENLFAQHQL